MKANNYDARKIRTVFKASGISTRYSVLDDYGRDQDFAFYPNSAEDAFPGTADRMQLYRQHALPLSIAAIENMLTSIPDMDLRDVTHLVVVSCTGMYAPGLDIDIIKALGLRTSVQRTCINFMGCYAAFNGLKVADALCAQNENARVLVVCTELCSIHFQRDMTDDNILANALFADGSAAVLVDASSPYKKRLRLESFYSDLALAGEQDMVWQIGDLGFEMRLSAYIPDLVRQSISDLVDKLLNLVGASQSDISHYALHPGGKKILQAIGEKLHLTQDNLAPAFSVLDRFGNMSSATVLFVLHDMLESLREEDNGSLILGAAFGPGLTLESMLLRCEITNL